MKRKWALMAAVAAGFAALALLVQLRGLETTSSALPPVSRGIPQAIEAIAQSAITMGVFDAHVSDAWYEPECEGISVFFLTDSGPVWSWYDPRSLSVVQRMTGDDVMKAASQHVDIETTAMTWQTSEATVAGRPRYLLGFASEGGGEVYVRLKTESCGILLAELVHQGGKARASVRELSIEPGKQPDYRDLQLSEPEVERRSAAVEEAYKAAEQYTGLKANYSRDAWVEPSCNAVAVLMVDRQGSATWLWYDLATKRIVDALDRQLVTQVIQQQFPSAGVHDRMWLARVDTPGSRPRYLAAFLRTGPEDLWLHFNTKECTIRSAQVQLVKDVTEVGRFVTLDLTAPQE